MVGSGQNPINVAFERERGVYRVLVARDVAHVAVRVPSEESRPEFFLRVLRALAEDQLPVFLIKLHREAITFSFTGARAASVESCLENHGFETTIRRDLALISVIASSMRDLTGIMVVIGDALNAAGARVFGLGDSHNSVQMMIDGAHLESSVAELNRAFGLGGSHE